MTKLAPSNRREFSGPRAVGAWGTAVAFAELSRSHADEPPRSILGRIPSLYLADELGWLRRLDPDTLDDDPTPLPVAIHQGDPGDPARWRLARWFVPGSGAALIRLDFPLLHGGVPHHAVTISVYDGPDDRIVRTIPAPAYPLGAWLSADGRQLVTSKFEDSFLDGVVGPSTWHTIELASGAILSTATFPGYDGERWTWPVLDPAARTAYRLLPLPRVDPVRDGGLRLLAIDVATGQLKAAT